MQSDFWDKKSEYYSHGDGNEDEVEVKPVEPKKEFNRKDAEETKYKRLQEQLDIIAPALKEMQRKMDEFDEDEPFSDEGFVEDVDHLNYTALAWEIDNELPDENARSWREGRQKGRGARGLPAFLGNAIKLLDVKQVVKELETSVMTSVSCSACKAGGLR